MTTAIDGPTSTADSRPKVRFVVLFALAVSLGLVPFALTIQSWLFLAITTVSIAVAALIATRAVEGHYAGHRPAAMEIALSLLGSLAIGLICGCFGIFVFILIRFAFGLYDWLILSVPLIAWTPETAPVAPWAKYMSVIVPGFFGWGVAVAVCSDDAPRILRNLYPSMADQRSSYFALAQQPKQLTTLWIQVAVCILAVVLVVSFPYFGQLMRPYSGLVQFVSYLGSVVGLLLLSLYWLTFTQDLWDTRSPDLPRTRSQPLVRKLQMLMEAAGYQVRLYPQTGDKEADPLIALLDFVAIRSDRSIAGRVKGYVDPVLLKRELASLQPPVRALEDQLSKNRKNQTIVLEPVLFLTGRPSRSMGVGEASEFATEPHVRVIDIEETELDEIVGGSDDARKADRARRLVDARTAMPTPPPAAGLATA